MTNPNGLSPEILEMLACMRKADQAASAKATMAAKQLEARRKRGDPSPTLVWFDLAVPQLVALLHIDAKHASGWTASLRAMVGAGKLMLRHGHGLQPLDASQLDDPFAALAIGDIEGLLPPTMSTTARSEDANRRTSPGDQSTTGPTSSPLSTMASTDKPLIGSVAPAVHTTASKGRSEHLLAPLVRKAQSKATDKESLVEVWTLLVAFAEEASRARKAREENPYPPLLEANSTPVKGIETGAVWYSDGSGDGKHWTRKNLADFLRNLRQKRGG